MEDDVYVLFTAVPSLYIFVWFALFTLVYPISRYLVVVFEHDLGTERSGSENEMDDI